MHRWSMRSAAADRFQLDTPDGISAACRDAGRAQGGTSCETDRGGTGRVSAAAVVAAAAVVVVDHGRWVIGRIAAAVVVVVPAGGRRAVGAGRVPVRRGV